MLCVGSRLLLECLLLARTWTFDSTDQIWSRLNQEHTNHAGAELAEIQKVNLKSEIVKIAIIPTSLGYGQPYMAEGTNG